MCLYKHSLFFLIFIQPWFWNLPKMPCANIDNCSVVLSLLNNHCSGCLLAFCLSPLTFLPFLCLPDKFQMADSCSFGVFGPWAIGIHFAEVQYRPECLEINIRWAPLNYCSWVCVHKYLCSLILGWEYSEVCVFHNFPAPVCEIKLQLPMVVADLKASL